VRYAGHTTAFHVLRTPVYWARLAARSPVGVFRVVRGVWRWVFDGDGALVRRAMSANATGHGYATTDAAVFARLEEQRRDLVRGRSTVAAVITLSVVAAGWTVAVTCPPWLSALLAASVVGFLGLAGRDTSRPVVSRYTSATVVPRLTSDLILTALGALGIAELNKGLRTGTVSGSPPRSPATGQGGAPRSTYPPG
jgi:S-DNA-T family DNA segregation ATPase FtsK/SpoIIIE